MCDTFSLVPMLNACLKQLIVVVVLNTVIYGCSKKVPHQSQFLVSFIRNILALYMGYNFPKASIFLMWHSRSISNVLSSLFLSDFMLLVLSTSHCVRSYDTFVLNFFMNHFLFHQLCHKIHWYHWLNFQNIQFYTLFQRPEFELFFISKTVMQNKLISWKNGKSNQYLFSNCLR